MLRDAGHTAELVDLPTRNLADDPEMLSGFHAIISAGEKIGAEALASLPSLRLISRFGVGTNEIDKADAARRGIAVCNAAGSFSFCVAECALSLMLNLLRDFVRAEQDFRRGDWSRFFEGRNARQLYGKCVGLVGFGDIAIALAELLAPFRTRILAYDVAPRLEVAERLGVTFVDLDTLAREADVISLHAPLLPTTERMVDESFLSKIKAGAILINTSRGALVDEAAVAVALHDGILAAYGADVFTTEPPLSDNPLLGAPHTMLLPHSGSNGIESVEYAGAYAAQNVIDFFSGKPPKTILNPDYLQYANKEITNDE